MDRDIKSKIRALRKIKKQSRKKSELRRDMNRKIRELKKKQDPVTPEKQALTDKIRHFYPYSTVDYGQFTFEQLQHHYDTKMKGKLIVNGIINRIRLTELGQDNEK